MDIVERLRDWCEDPHDVSMGELAEYSHEAANVIERLQAIAVKHGLWKEAPCCLCGYNGPNYFQPSVHKCAAIEDSE
jgi:hypothetical protein